MGLLALGLIERGWSSDISTQLQASLPLPTWALNLLPC